ncbi:MAG TPA: hypothetical protein VL096_08020 [Pirellulaceae bacterium]|nr:hypothetical protein [Pirellulaceae bacterium]
MLRRLLTQVAFLVVMLASSSAMARPVVELHPGRPFGVGRITVPLGADDANLAQSIPRLSLTDADGRIYYPAIATGKFRELLGGLLGGEVGLPGQATAYFLFTGDEPLKITFYTPIANTIVATPAPSRPRVYDRLLGQWWKEYQDGAKARQSAGEMPPQIDAYLTTMLSQRLKLPLAVERGATTQVSLPQKTLDLLLGVEKLRAETMRATLLGQNLPGEPINQPLPPSTDWSAFPTQEKPADLDIEPISLHVPMECFYIRFGRFTNYLWLDNLTEDYGGDLANMLTLRGQDLNLGGRVQSQLALQKNKLADLLGETVIADVAMIGRDIYTHEGAAIGMLFQAQNSRLLGNDFTQTRATILKREAANGATLETVKIADHDVSFLSTPDNRIRSFYAVDGNYHLVTTSKAIVERFYAAGQGRGALGNTAEFHNARTLMPTSRKDTIFVYFSSAFFQGLVEPQYQVELARRLQSVTDIELVQLARLAAKAEGHASGATDELVAGGYLPAGFGKRADGSGPIVEERRIVDSRRGARGNFLPIPDVDVRGISASEAARLSQLSEYMATQWKTMDPLMIGIRRFKLDDKGRERITFDANASPFDDKKYGGLTAMIGPPATSRVLPVAGDVIHLQAVMQGALLDPNAPPHTLFLGVQDHLPLAELKSPGLLKILRVLQSTPGYLGAWPRPGILENLPLGLGGVTDEFGFARMPLGLWRRTLGPWSALSFDPQLLGEVTEQFAAEETDNPAQARLHVTDLGSSRAAPWVNALFYERARQTSVANAMMLQHVMQQLRVPADQAKTTIEQLIDGKLVCVLGGEYKPMSYRDGATLWQSSQWPEEVDRAPADYQAPLLTWFRGLDADFTKLDGRVMLRGQLDMQRKNPETQLELPAFNLPNIFGDFGKTSPKKKPEKVPAPEEVPAPKSETRKPRDF